MKKTVKQIVTLIEGFVALCLGSSDRIAWMDQADAAAYTDGQKIFLPNPSGVEGELELLLSIAMREVAKITHTDAAGFALAEKPTCGYAGSVEDARIKQAIAADYKGAPGIFEAATSVTHAVALRECQKEDANPDLLKQLAVWFAANDALLGSEASALASQDIGELAQKHISPNALQRVIGLTQASPYLGSTQASLACAAKIHALLHPKPPNEPPTAPQPEDSDPQQEEDRQDPESQGDEGGSETQGDDSNDGEASQETPPQNDSGDSPGEGSDDVGNPTAPSNTDPNQSEEGNQEQPESEGEGASDGQGEQQQNDDPSSSSQAQNPDPDSQGDDGTESATPQGSDDASSQGEGDDAQSSTAQTDSASDTEPSATGAGQGGTQSNPQNAGQPTDGSQSDVSSDALSNLLAMLKGFDAARDIPESQAKVTKGEDPDPKLLQALAQALQAEDAMEAIAGMEDLSVEAMEVAESDPEEATEPAVDLMLALGASSGVTPLTFNSANTLDAVAGRLVNVLLRELHDKRPTKMLRRSSGRDIDVPNLWRLKRLGDTRVFRKKTPAAGVDAAVWILLDRSGSMRDMIGTAANATSAFALALQRISGVQTAIDVFPSDSASGSETILKFRQNPTQARDKLRTIGANGGTPTDLALRNIVPKLLATPVEKRVIVVVTDGEPDELHETRVEIAKAKAQGIDVIGIGIGSEASIESILPDRSVSIVEVGELALALEVLFKTKLSTSLMAA